MGLILALLMNNLAPGSIPAEKLAIAIMEAAHKHNIDPVVLTKIVLVESNGLEKAHNAASSDFGIAQINKYTARSMGVLHTCLMNYKCNLNTAAKIISDMKKFRVCMYNLGPKGKHKKYETACLRYERKISSL